MRVHHACVVRWAPSHGRRDLPSPGEQYLIKSPYANGTMMWQPGLVYTLAPGWLPMGPFAGRIGFAEPKTTEYLHDDGGEAWAGVAEELRRRGLRDEAARQAYNDGESGGANSAWVQGGAGSCPPMLLVQPEAARL